MLSQLRILLVVLLACLAMLSSVSVAADPATVDAVKWPQSRAPKIDGRPDEWAGVQGAESTQECGGGKASFKLAFDDRNLYAIVFVSDSSPLKNRSVVLQELFKGGDAISLCFGAGGKGGIEQRILLAQVNDQAVVWAMRPKWSDKKQAYQYHTEAAGEVSMDFVGPLEKASVAFVMNGDKKGYVAEVSIPWSELGVKPQGGLQLPFDLQVIFSDKTGNLNSDTAWWHSTGVGPTATMDIAVEARLYPDAWGRVRLTQTPAVPKAAPKVEEVDTAFTGPGTPIHFDLPRDALVSVLITRADGWVIDELVRASDMKKGSHTVYWDGRDRIGQPMPPGEYHYLIGYWDGIRTTFYGSVGNSGRPVYRTEDGMGSIGGAHGGPSAVSADAGGVYMLHSGEEGQKCLRKIDPTTGKAKWFASTGVFAGGFAVASDGKYCYAMFGRSRSGVLLGRFDAETGKPNPFPGMTSSPKVAEFADGGPDGLAIVGDKAYFAQRKINRVSVVDLKTGTLAGAIEIDAPRGICRLDDQTVLVCSGKNLLKLDLKSNKTSPAVDAPLEGPSAVCLDKAGNIYVADSGTSQQIKKFSAQGKLVSALGKEGGRAKHVPKYEPLEFNNVTGLVIGPDDNLWAVERADAPRRFVKLSTDGNWIEDFYGPNGYTTCGVDLDDPTTVYYRSGNTAYVEAKVDYVAYAKDPGNPVGAWKVVAIHNLCQAAIDPNTKTDLFADPMREAYGRIVAFKGTTGKRYLAKLGADICLFVDDGGRWKPAAFVRRGASDKGEPVAWSDANGDGLVQDDELSLNGLQGRRWCGMSRDLTIHGLDGDLKPLRVNDAGVPAYIGGAYTPTFKDPTFGPKIFEFGNYWTYPTAPTPDGARYLVTNIGPEQGKGFWDRATETRLIKVVDGQPKWIIGHHDGTLRHNGDNQMLMNLAGELDGVLLASEVAGTFTAYTSDGLTLGWIARTERGGFTSIGPTGWYVENVQPGLFFKDPQTGKRLLIGSSTEDVRILQIDGVFGDDITRLRGKLTLDSAQPRSAEVAGRTVIPYRTWTLYKSRYLGVVGYDWIWAKDIPSLTIRRDKALVADVRLRRDAGALCVFADVLDESPFTTDGDGAFGAADGVELLVGADKPADRTTAAAGDTRFFLTATPKPVTPGKADDLAGRVWVCRSASDGGKLTLLKDAKIVVVRRLDGLGYRLDAEIPLSALPQLTEPATVTFNRAKKPNVTEKRLDLAGPVRINAAVWHAEGTGPARRSSWAPSDLPGTDPASMNPSRWGEAELQTPGTSQTRTK